jgi:hypothetical protein
MITQTFRVTRVLAGHSPVARIDGVDDDDGLELHLEVPVDAVRGASPGQVIVVNWTLQASATPAARVESRPTVASAPAAVIDADFTTAATPRPAQTPGRPVNVTRPAGAAEVDQEFMSLMGRRSASAPSPAFTKHEIKDELNTLLGSAGAKGRK